MLYLNYIDFSLPDEDRAKVARDQDGQDLDYFVFGHRQNSNFRPA